MCGGIACSPAFMQADRHRFLTLLLFNAGRLLSYTLIGLVFGLFSRALHTYAGAMDFLRTVAGVLMILMGLSIGNWWGGLRHIESLGATVWKRIAPLARQLSRSDRAVAPLLTGGLWGWLPCGLVYTTLLWASSVAQSQQTGLLMLAFGFGTLPSMLAAGLFAVQIRRFLSHLGVRRGFGLLIILMGLWTLPLVNAWMTGGHH